MTAERGRVAYVVSRFPKITETFVLYEMKALEDLGAEVEVFALRREPPGPRHPEAAPYESRARYAPLFSWRVVRANLRLLSSRPRTYLDTWWHVVSGTWGSRKLFLKALACVPKCVYFAERMRKDGVRHVHAHFATHPALVAHVVHRLTGVPYSFTAHGSDLHVDRRMLSDKVAEAAFVVAVSDYNRNVILQECGCRYDDRVVVIHCGTDPEVFADAAPVRRNGHPSRHGDQRRAEDSLSCQDERLRIACVASLEQVKGHRFLLEACAILVGRGVDVHCDLAGDGRLRRELEALVGDLGLSERVTMHGAVARSEVRRILAASDVAVLASYPTRSGRREGIPVALMEAMMSGLPVVASGLSGIPELVEDGCTGYLVPPGDPWSLADALQRLVGAPTLRRAMGAAGRAKVRREFDLFQGAQRLLGEIERRGCASQYRDS